MDSIAYLIPDQASFFIYSAIILFIIGFFYVSDVYRNARNGYYNRKMIRYGYEENNGPAVWASIFFSANGALQSPINLQSSNAITVPSELNLLTFSDEFHQSPCEMKLYNTGLNAVLYAKWNGGRRPHIFGGPLENKYNFLNIRFRWGIEDEEGSEHMVDSKRFSLEMQASFMKNGDGPRCDILEAAREGDLLLLSYFFLVTPIDNPYLEPIVQAINLIKCPSSYVYLHPFPLKLLSPIFSKNYYYYEGSVTFPPCTEGVKWIVQAEPLLISSRQVSAFRKLVTCDMLPVLTNSRPVQCGNGREVLFYD